MKEKILIVEDHFIEANDLKLMLVSAGYDVIGIAGSVQKAKSLIAQSRPEIVLLDIFLKGSLTGIDLAAELREENISFVYLSANSNEDVLTAAKATQPYGFLVKPFRERDVLVTLEIARYRYQHALNVGDRQENLLKTQLEKIKGESYTANQKLLEIARLFQPYFPFEYLAVGIRSDEGMIPNELGFLRIAFDEYQVIGRKELMIITKLKEHELAALEATTACEMMPVFYDEPAFLEAFQAASMQTLLAETFQLRSMLVLPMPISEKETCYFTFFSRRPVVYTTEHILFFSRIQRTLTTVIKSFFPTRTLQSVKKNAPGTSSQKQNLFEGIIGKSHLLLSVFDQIMRVSTSDTSVLILGESGTGKERIADSIHQLSARRDHPFIKVNCAALPVTLIESELFGHEKGAFTGALDKRIGKFELASEGTIFLDEIGEMPFEMQVKLLRVLQEREIERVGGKSPKKINIRIIAATNRNLEKEVAEGRFRLDLYYRLNVFPIQMPALRDRKEDIPLLVAHFINYYNRKSGKKVVSVSDRALRDMEAYDWPGNIRELEHLVERHILLAKGPVIDQIALPSLSQKIRSVLREDQRIKTMQENERDHIIEVLRKCYGKIFGPGGAAELLNVPPTTLCSRMKKLGINRLEIE